MKPKAKMIRVCFLSMLCVWLMAFPAFAGYSGYSETTKNPFSIARRVTNNISYVLNGGKFADGYTAPSAYQEGTAVTLPTAENVERNHYTFSGWYKDANFGGEAVTEIPETQRMDVFYYAKWTPVNYSIGYTLDGGIISGQPTSYNIETETFTLPTPVKDGYSFDGWSGTGISGTQKTVTLEKGSYGDRSYTANWTAIKYTLTYDLAGGTVSKANPTSYYVTTSDFTLHNPTRTGYTFAGWTGSNGSTAQTSVSVVTGSTGNKSYTANWVINTYTITCEDWFVDSSGNRKVMLGIAGTKQFTIDDGIYGTDISGSEWGNHEARESYYPGYAYVGCSTEKIGANDISVYRYFYAWTNINLYDPDGEECRDGEFGTFSLSYDGGVTWYTEKSNEFDTSQEIWKSEPVPTNGKNLTSVGSHCVVMPYGTVIKIKDINLIYGCSEITDTLNLLWDGTSYSYTVTKADGLMLYTGWKEFTSVPYHDIDNRFYGPYINIPAETYTIEIYGTDLDKIAEFSAYDNGLENENYTVVVNSRSSTHITLSVTLDIAATGRGFEILCYVDEGNPYNVNITKEIIKPSSASTAVAETMPLILDANGGKFEDGSVSQQITMQVE